MRALAVGFVQRQQEGETVEVTRFVYEDGDLFDASREDLLSANVQQGVDYTVIEDWPAVERLLSEDGEPEPEYFEEYDPRGHDDIQELDHTAPGSIALYPKKHAGRTTAQPLLIRWVSPTGSWCVGQDPVTGAMCRTLVLALAPYHPDRINTPWYTAEAMAAALPSPSLDIVAGAAAAVAGHSIPPFVRRTAGTRHSDCDRAVCAVCARPVVSADYPLRCPGSTGDRFDDGAHHVPHFFHRECLDLDLTAARVGPRGEVVSTYGPHADFCGFACPSCGFHRAFGRPPTHLADMGILECVKRAHMDSSNSRAHGTTAGYAGIFARILEIEMRLGVPLVQRRPDDDPIPPWRISIMLEYYESALTPSTGNGPRVSTVSRVFTVLGHVAGQWGVPNPAAHDIPRSTLRGMRMRLGCVVTRAFAFKVALLLRFLRYMRTQPNTIENAILVVLVILSVFGFLRIGEAVRLRLRHYRRYARAAVQYFILELEWCKQDQFAAGSEVVIAAESKSGIRLMAHVDTLIARLDTEWNMTDPSALLLPLDASGKAHTGTTVLAALRPHLLAMQAAGEPLLENVDIATVITTKSFKRGGAASATDVNPDAAAISVHGWVTRRYVEALKSRSSLETYCDVEVAARNLPRRIRVTAWM